MAYNGIFLYCSFSVEPVLKWSTSTKRLPFPVGDCLMEVSLYMPEMGFNGPSF